MFRKVASEEIRGIERLFVVVKHRVSKAWGTVAVVKATINNARMSRVGWLIAGIAQIRGVIIPSISYSGDVWVAINKATKKFIKDEFKGMIYSLPQINWPVWFEGF